MRSRSASPDQVGPVPTVAPDSEHRVIGFPLRATRSFFRKYTAIVKFECLSLNKPLLRGLQATGYHDATPIQQKAIPQLLKGRDLVGCAQTGTGKTAAFVLPTMQRLMISAAAPTGVARRRRRSGRRIIRALILAPTRELAGQIDASLATYGRYTELRHAVIYGGVRQGPQVRALQAGIDILVATPGRLLDLVGQGHVELGAVEILILDEADRMLDMGFIHDLRKIVAQVPAGRQTLMFSATMPPEIRQLATQWLRRPTGCSGPEPVARRRATIDARRGPTSRRRRYDHRSAGASSRVVRRFVVAADHQVDASQNEEHYAHCRQPHR